MKKGRRVTGFLGVRRSPCYPRSTPQRGLARSIQVWTGILCESLTGGRNSSIVDQQCRPTHGQTWGRGRPELRRYRDLPAGVAELQGDLGDLHVALLMKSP
jgi:hypothetical protein